MKLSIELACESDPKWIATVMSDFDNFLKDHADCERKASAMAMSFAAKRIALHYWVHRVDVGDGEVQISLRQPTAV